MTTNFTMAGLDPATQHDARPRVEKSLSRSLTLACWVAASGAAMVKMGLEL